MDGPGFRITTGFALGPTQPSIQRVSGVSPGGRECQGVKLTFRLIMSYIYIYIYIYIYMEHLCLMFLDHTQRRSTVGRTPLDE